MREKPTTREILQELFEELEKEYDKTCETAYKPGYFNQVAEARASGLHSAMAMIVGIENKYGI